MTIPKNKLSGQTSDEKVKIIDLRFPKGEALDFTTSSGNVFPGYHMNKNNWITIILDGNMPTPEILNLLDQSYRISLTK
jgi:predicted DNA-binding protein (MmcQ/YjbR family)